jgi:RimJ/RimL family protein N-acetyltransferase
VIDAQVPVLRGEHVLLRPFRVEDAPEVAAGCNDPLTQRFLQQLPSPYTLDDAHWWITEGAPAAVAAGGRAYGVADPATDRIIGGVGITRHGRDCGEIGYWVAPEARGQGVATAAARLLAAHAYVEGTARLELRTEQENVGSQRVAIASGFGRESIARGAGQGRDGSRFDLIVWARLATDSGQPTARAMPDLPGGELTDGVVTLRPITADDAEQTYALRSLPECVLRSVPPVAPERDEVAWRCAHAPSQWLAGTRAELTIRDTATGAYAGEIALYYSDPGIGQAMIGYSMTREWRGRGLVTRAVNLVADWALTAVGVARLIAGTAPDNTASQRVLARAGFVREAYLREFLPGPDGTRVDDIVWVRRPS